MRQRIAFSTVECIKTIILFILIVLMLVLMVLLMLDQNGTREEALPTADRMVVYASGVQPMYAAGMDTARVTPYLLAYRRDGSNPQILHASDTVRKPYETLYPLLRDLLGSNAVGHTPDRETGQRLWSACIGCSDYIYIRYIGALPAAVIRAYTYSDEDSESVQVSDERAQGTSAYIRELFFIPGQALQPYREALPQISAMDADALVALTCDETGNITLFYESIPETALSAVPAADFGAEDSTDAYPAENIAAEAAVQGSILGTYTDSIAAISNEWQEGVLSLSADGFRIGASLEGLYRMPQAVLSPFDPAAALYPEPRKMSSVLGLLGMRESDTDNYYTDSDGNRVYLNASGRLTVSAGNAAVRYDALEEGGLELSDYLGYSSIGGEYLLSEYLRAADRLLSQLEVQETAFGGDALVCSLIEADLVPEQASDTLVLTYGYTCRGIPLLDERGEVRRAMVLQARDGVVSHLELYPCFASVSEEEQYLLPQSVALQAMELEHAAGADMQSVLLSGGLHMAYLCGTSDGYGAYTADWIAYP